MLESNFCYIGIDLGWLDKKTTGICILENEKIILSKDVYGKNAFSAIKPYLKDTKVITVDAPLSLGRGKGRMRLYEKFFSTRNFREEKIKIVPPAVMPQLCKSAELLLGKLEESGFSLGINLIETSVFLLKKIVKEGFILRAEKLNTENEESSLICAKIAFLHSEFKTRYIGYKDGFLFLPELSFWDEKWQDTFNKAWAGRDRLKYRRLTSNIF
jgi:predicted nuclease with RNAse H fold